MSATTNLPTLVGSEKQVAWATDIRAKALPVYAEQVALLRAQGAAKGGRVAELVEQAAAEIEAYLGRCNSAEWWIHMRALHGRAAMQDDRYEMSQILTRMRRAIQQAG